DELFVRGDDDNVLRSGFCGGNRYAGRTKRRIANNAVTRGAGVSGPDQLLGHAEQWSIRATQSALERLPLRGCNDRARCGTYVVCDCVRVCCLCADSTRYEQERGYCGE